MINHPFKIGHSIKTENKTYAAHRASKADQIGAKEKAS
jgi:hypothetical protein